MYQPRSLPYGDIYKVPTTAVDNMANRLYAEQKQRELTQQNEAKLLDTEFSKNVSKLRDADIPEYTKKYQDYKNAKINLLKGKFKTNDDFIKAQLDAQRAMADWGSLGAKSIQEKETEEQYAKAVMNDKTGRYDANAPKVLIERRKTPLSKFKQEVTIPGTNTVVPIDLSDIDGLVKYKLGTIDFSKDWDNSIGQKTPMRIGESQPFDIEGGLQSQKKIYKGFSKTAPEVATSFLQRVVGSQKTDSLLKEHPELNDPNVLSQIDSNYDKLINSDLYKEVYKGKPIEFPTWMHDTPQGKVAMYLAKQYAINNPPREELDKPVTKLKAVMDRAWREKLAFNKLTFGQSMQKIAANKTAGLPQEDLGYLSDEVAAEVGQDLEVELGGKRTQRRVIFVDDVDPERLNLITGKDPSKPMQSGVKAIPIKVPQPDGSVIVKKGYYQDLNTGDWEGDNGQKISRERVKDAYINKYAPTKFKAKTGTKGAEKKQGEADDL